MPLQLLTARKKAYKKFEKVNEQHMDAFKDAIMAHAVYYPVVEILSAPSDCDGGVGREETSY